MPSVSIAGRVAFARKERSDPILVLRTAREATEAMPLYEYQCTKCGEKFEAYRPLLAKDDNVKCPKCGAAKPKRLISSFSSRNSGTGCAPPGGFVSS